jgi:hypothetical protein
MSVMIIVAAITFLSVLQQGHESCESFAKRAHTIAWSGHVSLLALVIRYMLQLYLVVSTNGDVTWPHRASDRASDNVRGGDYLVVFAQYTCNSEIFPG